MFPFIARATFYEEDEQHEITTLLYANSLSDAAQIMDDYCRPEVLELHYVGCDGDIIELPQGVANAIILGNGDYREGYRILEDK